MWRIDRKEDRRATETRTFTRILINLSHFFLRSVLQVFQKRTKMSGLSIY